MAKTQAASMEYAKETRLYTPNKTPAVINSSGAGKPIGLIKARYEAYAASKKSPIPAKRCGRNTFLSTVTNESILCVNRLLLGISVLNGRVLVLIAATVSAAAVARVVSFSGGGNAVGHFYHFL